MRRNVIAALNETSIMTTTICYYIHKGELNVFLEYWNCKVAFKYYLIKTILVQLSTALKCITHIKPYFELPSSISICLSEGLSFCPDIRISVMFSDISYMNQIMPDCQTLLLFVFVYGLDFTPKSNRVHLSPKLVGCPTATIYKF